MAISVPLYGTTRFVPETDETDWGSEVTTQLVDVETAVDTFVHRTAGNLFLHLNPGSLSLAAAATITPTKPVHRVSGTPGAVTLSASNAIADGSQDGQLLTLIGSSDVNTVTILDAANTNLNGPITLLNCHALELYWSSPDSVWHELNRSN
jgi:hypothetical protein